MFIALIASLVFLGLHANAGVIRSTGERCVSNCTGMFDGDYQSCESCYIFVTCSNEYMLDPRPCAENLVWDDIVKECRYTSTTCDTGSGDGGDTTDSPDGGDGGEGGDTTGSPDGGDGSGDGGDGSGDGGDGSGDGGNGSGEGGDTTGSPDGGDGSGDGGDGSGDGGDGSGDGGNGSGDGGDTTGSPDGGDGSGDGGDGGDTTDSPDGGDGDKKCTSGYSFVAFGSSGGCYKSTIAKVPFETARAACAAEGAALISAPTMEEFTAVREFIKQEIPAATTNDVWVAAEWNGAFDGQWGVGTDYTWADGTPAQDAMWAVNEPSAGNTNYGEPVQVCFYTKKDYMLDNRGAARLGSYVCEKEL